MTHSTGVPMRLVTVRVRFKPWRGRRSSLEERIPEIRKLLRTDMSIADICRELGISRTCFGEFIKRRGLCDLKNRKDLIGTKKRIAEREAKCEDSMDSFTPKRRYK